MNAEDPELAYYRSVEDLFATLRGTPHILSPRDFQLLRSWWRDKVPLAAVVTGLTEVFARNRERDDGDPVVSLSYCRHAVKRHAARLAAMRVGAPDGGRDPAPSSGDDAASIERLAARLTAAAARHHDQLPAVAAVIKRTAELVTVAGRELPQTLIENHLFALEAGLLADCRRALPADRRALIEERARAAAEAASTTDDARERSARALRDREIRILLDLPRLELDR
jgi:hypothetical protein